MTEHYDQREAMHAVRQHQETIAKLSIDDEKTIGSLDRIPSVVKDGKVVIVHFDSHRDAINGHDSICNLMKQLARRK
jgi:hypothetical protein